MTKMDSLTTPAPSRYSSKRSVDVNSDGSRPLAKGRRCVFWLVCRLFFFFFLFLLSSNCVNSSVSFLPLPAFLTRYLWTSHMEYVNKYLYFSPSPQWFLRPVAVWNKVNHRRPNLEIRAVCDSLCRYRELFWKITDRKKNCVNKYLILNTVFLPHICRLLVSFADFRAILTPFSEAIRNCCSSF